MSLWRIFRMPVLLAWLSGTGMIAALIADGAIDLLWTTLAAAPLPVLALSWARRRRAQP